MLCIAVTLQLAAITSTDGECSDLSQDVTNVFCNVRTKHNEIPHRAMSLLEGGKWEAEKESP